MNYDQRISELDAAIAAETAAYEAARLEALRLSLERAAHGGDKATTVDLAQPIRDAWAKAATVAASLQRMKEARARLAAERDNLAAANRQH